MSKFDFRSVMRKVAKRFSPSGIVPEHGLLIVRNGRIMGTVKLTETQVKAVMRQER